MEKSEKIIQKVINIVHKHPQGNSKFLQKKKSNYTAIQRPQVLIYELEIAQLILLDFFKFFFPKQ